MLSCIFIASFVGLAVAYPMNPLLGSRLAEPCAEIAKRATSIQKDDLSGIILFSRMV
jgi:hypothetical protein